MRQEEVDRLRAEVKRLTSEANADRDTARRLAEAQAYNQKYLMPTSWGKNVWHAILDDAKALRGEEGK